MALKEREKEEGETPANNHSASVANGRQALGVHVITTVAVTTLSTRLEIYPEAFGSTAVITLIRALPRQ